MNLTLGFSPCPNDCFMFDAIVNHRIDLHGLSFTTHLADVEALNRETFAGKADVTNLAITPMPTAGVTTCCSIREVRLAATRSAADFGSADLARKCGRESCASRFQASTRQQTSVWSGVSGPDKTPLVFSDIEGALLDGRFDAGLIIHENRFTYQAKGLHKIVDLGEFWKVKPARPFHSALSPSGVRPRRREAAHQSAGA